MDEIIAAFVRYLPATDTRGARYAVTTYHGRTVHPLDYAAASPTLAAVEAHLDRYSYRGVERVATTVVIGYSSDMVLAVRAVPQTDKD